VLKWILASKVKIDALLSAEPEPFMLGLVSPNDWLRSCALVCSQAREATQNPLSLAIIFTVLLADYDWWINYNLKVIEE